MPHRSHNRRKVVAAAIASALVLVVVQGALIGCSAAAHNLRITNSQAATDIWHAYEILPNYRYYFWGPVSQPFYLVGIDSRYRLTSANWQPVDLTPAMLKNWFNYIHPRVGYSPFLWGAVITGPKGERIGLWYSVRDWRRLGSARLGEDNQVALTTPPRTDPRKGGFIWLKRDGGD